MSSNENDDLHTRPHSAVDTPPNDENRTPEQCEYGEFSALPASTPQIKRKRQMLGDLNGRSQKRSNAYTPNETLHEVVEAMRKKFTKAPRQSVNVINCEVNTSDLNSSYVDTIATKHLRNEFDLHKSVVLLYKDEGKEELEILDGRHRIAAIKQIFFRRYGNEKLLELTAAQMKDAEVEAIVLDNIFVPGLKTLNGWIFNKTMSPEVQRLHHRQKKDIADLMEMKVFLFPRAPRNSMKRTMSFSAKSAIKEVLGDVRAHYFRAAFVHESDQEAILEVADLVDKRRIVNGRSLNPLLNESSHAHFWSMFLDTYDGALEPCKEELKRLVEYCKKEGTITGKQFVEKLKVKSTPLNVFLNTYYKSLPPSCWMFKCHKFEKQTVNAFMNVCKSSFELDRILGNNEVPCKLKMLKLACLTLNPGNTAFPLFTTLDDLRANDAKDMTLCSDASFVFVDTIAFEDCSEVVFREIRKMEGNLHHFLLSCKEENLPEWGSWKALATLLKQHNYKLEKTWLAPHIDVDMDSVQREGYVLHFTNIEGHKLPGHQNKVIMMRDLPKLFPSHSSGCYFVGTTDCRDIRPGVVPQEGNNVIIFRSPEDLNMATAEFGQNAFDLDDQEMMCDLTSNSAHTPSTPRSEALESLHIAD